MGLSAPALRAFFWETERNRAGSSAPAPVGDLDQRSEGIETHRFDPAEYRRQVSD